MTGCELTGALRRVDGWVSGPCFVVAAIASMAVVAGCVSPSAPVTNSPTASASTGATVSPAATVAQSAPSAAPSETAAPEPQVDWGPFPPNHLDAARDLSAPQFPEEISTFVLDDVSQGPVSAVASYGDYTDYVAMDATVIAGFAQYEVIVDSLSDAAYHGRAVCGHSEKFPDNTVCVMVGQGEVLRVGSSSDIDVGAVEAFAEEIYGLL